MYLGIVHSVILSMLPSIVVLLTTLCLCSQQKQAEECVSAVVHQSLFEHAMGVCTESCVK